MNNYLYTYPVYFSLLFLHATSIHLAFITLELANWWKHLIQAFQRYKNPFLKRNIFALMYKPRSICLIGCQDNANTKQNTCKVCFALTKVHVARGFKTYLKNQSTWSIGFRIFILKNYLRFVCAIIMLSCFKHTVIDRFL